MDQIVDEAPNLIKFTNHLKVTKKKKPFIYLNFIYMASKKLYHTQNKTKGTLVHEREP